MHDFLNSTDKFYHIYFHNDLDGICSAIALKHYLNSNNKTIRAINHLTYGDILYKTIQPYDNTISIALDYSSSDIPIDYYIDHHENNYNLKGIIDSSYLSTLELLDKEIGTSFTQEEITTVSDMDSANFLKYNIKPQDFIRLKYNTNESNIYLAIAINKLIQYYKYNENFLELLVYQSDASLISIYENILNLADRFKKSINAEAIENDIKHYLNTTYKDIHRDFVEINNSKLLINNLNDVYFPRSGYYDRYYIFELYPDIDILINIWGFGIQISKNPFKEKIDINLNTMVGSLFDNISFVKLSFASLKNIKEKYILKEKNVFGFKFKAISEFIREYPIYFKDKFLNKESLSYTKILDSLEKSFNKESHLLDNNDIKLLNLISFNIEDYIKFNVGGHSDIVNISNLNLYQFDTKIDKVLFLTNEIINFFKK